VFLFLFFLFHNQNLELNLPLFLSWLKNLVSLVVFVPMIVRPCVYWEYNCKPFEDNNWKTFTSVMNASFLNNVQ